MTPRRLVCAAVLALCVSTGAAGDPAPARLAPDCALSRLTGAAPVRLHELRGRVLWVDFWASWCRTCAEAFPFLDDLDQDLRAQGLEVVGVNVGEAPGDAERFLAEHPVGFAQLADADGMCPRDFGVEVMPTAYLIDREGRIRFEQRGFRASDAAALRIRIEALLAEP